MVRKLTKFDAGIGTASKSTLILAFQLFTLVFAFANVTECALGSTEAKSFALFMNRLRQYENSFKESFACFDVSKKIQKLSTLRTKLLLCYVVAPYWIIVSAVMLGFKGGSLLTYIYMLHISVALVEDVKVIMCFEVIAQCFANLREVINLERSTVKALRVGKIRKWRSLVLFLRNQVTATGNYQTSHQLCIMVCTVFCITTAVFVLLNGTFDSTHGLSLRLVLSLVAVTLVVRVFGKILAAERITSEVSQKVPRLGNRN